MALTELELKRCEKPLAAFMTRRRPPDHIREKLDIGYRISVQCDELAFVTTRITSISG